MINHKYSKWMIFSIIGILIFNIAQLGLCSDFVYNSEYIQPKDTSKELRNIMLTGYWNPTGQMIAPFSNNTYLNPRGWKGKNWEGSSFNIYSFFPKPGTYNGTFEVDYQDTWEDFWNITNEIKPIAIISFGAGSGPWEIEYNARNLNVWVPDNNPPYQPTPCPPDHTKPVGYVRHATLPVQSIADEVNNQTTINAWVDWNGNPGAYLCEYMAYLGMWYQDIHNDTSEPDYCLASGFIHVNAGVPLKNAMEATNVTIREVIKYLLSSNQPPGKPTIEGPKYGDVDIEYEYRISVSDPDGDNLLPLE
jgi:pyrrolidone-carboxylate peptidase